MPLTGSCNSVLVILAGLSLTSYGLYSSYRKAYGKEK
ncbi:putative 5'-nucleotidase precursor [Streptococcus mutans KK21]|nr:putative 5'-nucleotidase precursor [Streptococcus mutans KK21]